jgi:hypothetical protein
MPGALPVQPGDRHLSALLQVHKGKRKTTYTVRWTVAGNEFRETYETRALADSRRADLKTATKNGEPFDLEEGLPVSEVAVANARSWYEHAVGYVNRRWDPAAGNTRASIAETLATVTPVLLSTDRGRPANEYSVGRCTGGRSTRAAGDPGATGRHRPGAEVGRAQHPATVRSGRH